jgi:hypothetical protein
MNLCRFCRQNPVEKAGQRCVPCNIWSRAVDEKQYGRDFMDRHCGPIVNPEDRLAVDEVKNQLS